MKYKGYQEKHSNSYMKADTHSITTSLSSVSKPTKTITWVSLGLETELIRIRKRGSKKIEECGDVEKKTK